MAHKRESVAINRPPKNINASPITPTTSNNITVQSVDDKPNLVQLILVRNTLMFAIVAAHIHPKYTLKPYTQILSGTEICGVIVNLIFIMIRVTKRPSMHNTDKPIFS